MCINNRHLKADFYFPFWVHRILVIEASKLIQFTWILSLQYKCKPSTCPHSWFIYLPTSIYPLVFSYSLCEFFFFFFLAALCSMRDLSSPTRDQTCAPCSGSTESNHWTARDVPYVNSFSISSPSSFTYRVNISFFCVP